MRYLKIVILLVILSLFNGFIFYCFNHITSITDGSFIYPLDDVYIHLAVAKHFAMHGVWGVTGTEFCSTSSSPIFTFMLSTCIFLFGDSSIYPFVLNLIFANALIVMLFMFFKKNMLAFGLMAIALVSPILLYIQVFNGMEHTLHILLITGALLLLYKMVEQNFENKKYIYVFVAVISLSCLTRYESMFFVCPLLLVLLLHKQYKLTAVILFAGFLPVILFGLYSISNGGYFFPNSLILKGNIHSEEGMLTRVFGLMYRSIYNLITFLFGIPVFLIISAAVVDFATSTGSAKAKIYPFLKKYSLVLLVFATMLLHSAFAGFGWSFRYEIYLYSILFVALIVTMVDVLSSLKSRFPASASKVGLYAGVVILFFGIVMVRFGVYRIDSSKDLIYEASGNIYDQQVQTARFLNKYYNTSKVAANDIGSIAYFTDVDLLDLIGLGSTFMLEEKLSMKEPWYTQSFIQGDKPMQEPYNQYKIIVIYDTWFGIESKEDYERLGWIKVAESTLVKNVICGGATVSYYTSDLEEAPKMREHMLEFQKQMPKGATLTVFD